MPDSNKFHLQYSQHSSANISTVALLSTIVSKAVSVTILAPFNFIENRYQVMGEMKRNGLIEDLYKGYSDCIITAVKQQNGLKTLWKGNFAKILLSWSGLAFSLTAGDYGKRQFTKIYKSTSPDGIQLLKYFGNIAGMISSLASIILTYPLQYAYIRLLADKQSLTKDGVKQFKSIRHVISSTLAQDGLRGLYRGVFTSFGAIALYRVSYFGLYEMWRNTQEKNLSIFQKFVASYLITLSASVIAYPANTIRKRMMMRSLQKQKYRWSGGCLKYIIEKQGFLALYRGFPMALITAISNSLFLITYDNIIGQAKLNHE